MLPAGVLVHRACKPLSFLSFRIIFLCRVGLCVWVFYSLKALEKIFEILLSVGKVEALLQALVCALACAACKCAYTCALAII
jgi:hypothetical protein